MYFEEIKSIEILNPIIANKKVLIWGGGEEGHIVYKKYVPTGVFEVLYFIDSDKQKWHKKIFDNEILAPEEIKNFDRETPVVIATQNKRYFEDIVFKLHDLGFKNIISTRKDIALPYFFDTNLSRRHLIEARDNINLFYGMLHDDISRHVLEDIIFYRLTNELKYIRHAADICKDYPQYFPEKSIFSAQVDEVFIDGGCCDASTIGEFEKWCGKKYKKVYAFEPSKILANVCRENIKYKSYNAEVINKGLYSKTGEMSFAGGYSIGTGHLSENGDSVVDVVALDEFLIEEAITFIKMDIEGSEIEALHGCVETIRRNHPKLAICIYHKFSDLWEIPIWLHDNFPDYKFYLRQHSSSHAETVLYARWDEKINII